MKRNMSKAMDRLEIDEEMRGLIRQLWKHCYRTDYSCSGHGHSLSRYISFNGEGDGWFEENAYKWELRKSENGVCCFISSKFDKICSDCSAGLNGVTIFRGSMHKRAIKI